MSDNQVVRGGILDFWCFAHFGFFLFLGTVVEAIWSPYWLVHLVYGVVLSYGWEIGEFFLQRAYPKLWSNRVEHPVNSWVIDPCCNILGLFIGVAIVMFYRRPVALPS